MTGTFPLGRAFLAAALLAGSAVGASAVSRGPVASPTSAEQLLLRQANQDRMQRDLPQLKFDPLLSQAARFHAEQMAQHEDISHAFPGEPDLSVRGASAGARFSLITENVAEAGELGIIHDLWMHSPGHRANLLDPEVNSVGIAVVTRNNAVFAVEDFASTVTEISLSDQEAAVSDLITTTGVSVAAPTPEIVLQARQTCSLPAGYAGARQPWFIMRYTASRLNAVPRQLQAKLASGVYHKAVVGACAPQERSAFTAYSIAVLLFP